MWWVILWVVTVLCQLILHIIRIENCGIENCEFHGKPFSFFGWQNQKGICTYSDKYYNSWPLAFCRVIFQAPERRFDKAYPGFVLNLSVWLIFLYFCMKEIVYFKSYELKHCFLLFTVHTTNREWNRFVNKRTLA